MSHPALDAAALYLDDLVVGQTFETATHLIDVEQIMAFARNFDPQPFHLDDEAAKQTLFGGLCASGWHTAAITMRLIVDMRPNFANGVIGKGGEISWPQPTRPGDILKVFSTIAAITPSRSRPDRGVVTMLLETKNQRGEIVQVFKPQLVVFRRDAKP